MKTLPKTSPPQQIVKHYYLRLQGIWTLFYRHEAGTCYLCPSTKIINHYQDKANYPELQAAMDSRDELKKMNVSILLTQ